MSVTDTIEISLKDVYQLLIGECRYGYSRNNHLMPSGAYDKVKRLIPKIYDADSRYAIYTIKQICEECISDQISGNFYDGEDDEHGNRKEAIEFVEWCLDWIQEHETDKQFYAASPWRPYNYDLFELNLKHDREPKFNVYEYENGSVGRKITDGAVSKAAALDIVFGGLSEGTYRREEIKLSDDWRDRRRHYVYHLLKPVEKDFYVEHI